MKELLYLKDEQLKHLIEKLFISYRETFSDSKKILNKYDIGLAHQKAIHFISALNAEFKLSSVSSIAKHSFASIFKYFKA